MLRRTTQPLDGGALGEIAPDDAKHQGRACLLSFASCHLSSSEVRLQALPDVTCRHMLLPTARLRRRKAAGSEVIVGASGGRRGDGVAPLPHEA
jgi:hypothetical protein